LRTEVSDIDLRGLAADVSALRKQLLQELGPEDYAHLKRVERWGRACTAAGYATAWIAPNPVSMLLLSVGNFVRWAGVTHPISHRGYDRIEAVPSRHTSEGFAKGRRRFLDWMDWIVPEAWHHEHDVLHHYRLGEDGDPDQVERNLEWLRRSKLPLPLKYAVVAGFAAIWKPAYYAPTTIQALRRENRRKVGENPEDESLLDWRMWLPLTSQGRELWARSYLPYIAARFGAIPALFAPLGALAVANVWLNSAGAEVLTNLYSFLMIVPNHAGDDLLRFDEPAQGKGVFHLRQITGSVNYRSSGPVTDFLQGWLNYQIEHHLFPDVPLSQYRKIAPQVRQICEKHGIPYREESVFKRLKKAVDVMVGNATMQRPHAATEARTEVPRAVPASPASIASGSGNEAVANLGYEGDPRLAWKVSGAEARRWQGARLSPSRARAIERNAASGDAAASGRRASLGSAS
jgi:fatty acid desaturase